MGGSASRTSVGNTTGFLVEPCCDNGDAYSVAHIGCNQCGRRLDGQLFFACKTCAERKIGCEISCELCADCVRDHDIEDHTVLMYKNRRCLGRVTSTTSQGRLRVALSDHWAAIVGDLTMKTAFVHLPTGCIHDQIPDLVEPESPCQSSAGDQDLIAPIIEACGAVVNESNSSSTFLEQRKTIHLDADFSVDQLAEVLMGMKSVAQEFPRPSAPAADADSAEEFAASASVASSTDPGSGTLRSDDACCSVCDTSKALDCPTGSIHEETGSETSACADSGTLSLDHGSVGALCLGQDHDQESLGAAPVLELTPVPDKVPTTCSAGRASHTGSDSTSLQNSRMVDTGELRTSHALSASAASGGWSHAVRHVSYGVLTSRPVHDGARLVQIKLGNAAPMRPGRVCMSHTYSGNVGLLVHLGHAPLASAATTFVNHGDAATQPVTKAVHTYSGGGLGAGGPARLVVVKAPHGGESRAACAVSCGVGQASGFQGVVRCS